LTVNCVVPPDQHGGAEFSAIGLAIDLAQAGHRVTLFGAERLSSTSGAQAKSTFRGVEVRRRKFDRPYDWLDGMPHDGLTKLRWHVADHFKASNETLFEQVIDDVAPDAVIVHNTQGIGFNLFRVLARRGIPTVHVLHDLGLVCLNRAMFRGAEKCRRHCFECRLVSRRNIHLLRSLKRFALVSPSRANLQTLSGYADLNGLAQEVIPNAVDYPIFDKQVPDGPSRFVFAGRLSPEKGFNFLISVLRDLEPTNEFRLEILGSGPEETSVREMVSGDRRFEFRGTVSLEEVGRAMSRSDMLLVPSLWDENFPGVVVHALRAGLPVAASAAGGMKEMIEDGVSGVLLPKGDAGAWRQALTDIGFDRERLGSMGQAAYEAGQRYLPARAVSLYLKLIHKLSGVDAEGNAA
jgi:glycosyltransferase involved in cell wall biosynthesis